MTLLLVAFVGCYTRQDCFEAQERFVDEISRQGGFIESCPPDKEWAIVHFDGPPHVSTACLPVSYGARLPDCDALDLSASTETDTAICRAKAAFPDEIALIGANPRVDVMGSDVNWRVRFASPASGPVRRGILILLGDPSLSQPRAILY